MYPIIILAISIIALLLLGGCVVLYRSRPSDDERVAIRDLQHRIEELMDNNDRISKRCQEQSDEIIDLKVREATLISQRDQAIQSLEETKTMTAQLKEEMRKEFALVAENVIESKSRKVTDSQKDSLKVILDPLNERIEAFKRQVETSYLTESKERHTLTKVIEDLKNQNIRLSKEANDLSDALRGQSKVQGDWGEMILERILEDSGLRNGHEYELQSYITDDDGKQIRHAETSKGMRPDAIIHFPDNRLLVIDAKVSLTDFLGYSEADDENTRDRAAHAHLASVKRHIDELYRKDYSRYLPCSPDFVLLFFPNEAALTLAMQYQTDLWNYAYRKKIILLGPTNLIGMLHITYDLWTRERQEKSIMQIIDQATKMYDKFVLFSESFVSIGESLDTVRKNYDKARNQLSEGRGNLVGQIVKLKKLGVSPKRDVQSSLLPGEDDDVDETV